MELKLKVKQNIIEFIHQVVGQDKQHMVKMEAIIE